MCGIVGIINKNGTPPAEKVLRTMMGAIKHRGPDGSGIFITRNIALGHNRLSIIDIETGGQPMFSDDNNYAIVYNGEAYNYRELKSDLEGKGISFYTRSDTEVVLKGLISEGKNFIPKINGMFSFAFLDIRKNALFLARDRFGVKPLYFAELNDAFIFASEVKSLLEHPSYNREFDFGAFNEYLTFQNIFSNRTFFKKISLMPSGTVFEINLNTLYNREVNYWDYEFSRDKWPHSFDDTTNLVRDTFTKAVSRQMVSDVPVGSYLSGGIDSGAITSVASTINRPLLTFTCGFDLSDVSGLELDYDERIRAEIVSSYHRTRHYEVILNSKDLEWCIDDVMKALDYPMLGMTYPNYFVAELASKYVKVVLSGAGGDELFGGYPWRYYVPNSDQINFDDYSRDYFNSWQRLVLQDEKKLVFRSHLIGQMDMDEPYDIFKDLLVKGRNKTGFSKVDEYFNLSLYLELKTFLKGLLLIDDKLHMSHSVESRVPFLDNDLVDLALKIPPEFKLKGFMKAPKFNENETAKRRKYEGKTNVGKYVFREALSQLLPKEIYSAPKQGFSSPEESWIKKDRLKFIENECLGKNSPILDFLNRRFLEEKLSEHLSGTRNNRLFIWSIISVNSFLKNFFKN